MNWKKYMGLVVGGAVALVLLIVVLLLMLKFRSSHQKVDQELKMATQRLAALHARDPFPSESNVDLVQTNVAVTQAFFDELMAALRKGQFEPKKLEPAEFPLVLERTIRRQHQRAATNAVALPPRFAFGFDRYAMGALPRADDVPRLAIQVDTVDILCDVLFRSKIKELIAIERPVFEASAVAPVQEDPRAGRRYGSAPAEAEPPADTFMDPSGLFARERYVLTFRGLDSSLGSFLNSLAAHRRFMVVTRVDVENEGGMPKLGAAKAPAAALPGFGTEPAAPPPPTAREERVVAGRELIKATVEVEVYRFLAPPRQEGA